MAVVVRTVSSQVLSPDGRQAARPVPGDVVRGRILHVSPDGRTTLQIGPHQVAFDRSLSGRAGDILLFEVLPSDYSKRLGDTTSSGPLVLRHLEDARSAPQASGRAIPEKASTGHLSSTGRVAARVASAPIPAENHVSATGSAPLMVSALQMLDALRVLGRKWIQRSRYRPVPTDRREGDDALKESGPRADGRVAVDRGTINAEKTLTRASDWYGAYDAGFKLAADRDLRGKALIKLQAPKTGKSRRDSDGTLTAWLGLDLENTGRIEVDVQMSPHVIRVCFRTDNEDTGDAIRSETARLRIALKHLAPEVYCCVQVENQHRADDAALNSWTVTAGAGIDCKI